MFKWILCDANLTSSVYNNNINNPTATSIYGPVGCNAARQTVSAGQIYSKFIYILKPCNDVKSQRVSRFTVQLHAATVVAVGVRE